MLSLDWQRVDLERGLIDWERPNAPITRKRRGKNPVNPKLLAHLRRWQRNGHSIGPVLTFRGRPVKDIKKSFSVAAKRAHLAGVTPHTLRHTAATWLAQSPGVSVFEAAGFLGMTSATFAERYAHHDPEYQRNAARAY